jgi:two-component system sensor histidine kinase KdpD
MSRLQSGAVRINKEEQPLEEVVGAAMARFEDQFGTRKVTTNLPPHLPMVPIDATLMQQVFINLIENALKYSPPTGSLHVAALKGEDSILVEVSDRGPGIPAGEEKKIFDPFSRATAASGEHADQRNGGAGLGLAICRAIVEAHGGAIWVENRPRGGAVFRFTLPLKKP